MSYVATWSLLLLYLGLAVPRFRQGVARLAARLGDATVALLLVPYLLAVHFRPPPLDLVRWVVYLALPVVLLRLRPPDARPLDWAQVLTILALWIPVEPDLFILLARSVLPGVSLSAVVPAHTVLLPEIRGALLPGVSLPLDGLMAIVLALYLFLVRYPIAGLGFTWRFEAKDFAAALAGWGAFGLVGVPLGLWMGFLRLEPRRVSAVEVLVGIVGGYLMTALVEEVLFRGVIQNLLTQRLQQRGLALGVAALIFGLAHLNNATPRFGVPNWRYVGMAFLAGLSYGAVWLRTGKVTASALTHMLVNLMWGILFH